jgi:hypothetical protein
MLNFLTPYLTYIKIVAGVVVATAIFASGYALSNHFAQNKIDQLNQSLGEYKTAYASLSAATAEQNDAINKLNAQSSEREKAAAIAQAQAKAAVKLAQRRAAAILSQKRPEGVNLCDAASQAFDEELKVERGVK